MIRGQALLVPLLVGLVGVQTAVIPPAHAQTASPPTADATPEVTQDAVEHGVSAVLRGLDKVSGQTTDFEVARGGFVAFGPLEVEMNDCRYPAGNPAGDAYAWLTIRAERGTAPLFAGWMIASSPALNGLDHPRYDIWVIRCKT